MGSLRYCQLKEEHALRAVTSDITGNVRLWGSIGVLNLENPALATAGMFAVWEYDSCCTLILFTNPQLRRKV